MFTSLRITPSGLHAFNLPMGTVGSKKVAMWNGVANERNKGMNGPLIKMEE
jgi:hypothetical protein